MKEKIRKEKEKQQQEVRDEVQIALDEEDDENITVIRSKRSSKLGPMDRYASKIDLETSVDTRRKTM